jgi:hypothetical protein
MKNKESKTNVLRTTPSIKTSSKIDPLEAAKIISGGRPKSQSKIRAQNTGPSKTQIERLKKFYNTTRWLPNSAFTTYFGKPAFENYGYGNLNPTYGGLFYGNYMLSHNVNPMDGQNKPESKQVYSSAMLKSIKRNEIRRPSPPRKTPDEIRNTRDELEEIRGRNPIFQLPNNFPPRDIIKPNLVKARVFRSGKNTPVDSDNEKLNEFEEFDIEDVINNRLIKKKKKTYNSKYSADFNPFEQGKIKLAKKKNKEELNQKSVEKHDKNQIHNQYDNSQISREEIENNNYSRENIEDEEYLMKKQFYEKMLKEEDDDLQNYQTNANTLVKQPSTTKYLNDNENIHNDQPKTCASCQSASFIDSKIRLKKKENPALLEPQFIKYYNLLLYRHTYVCCLHCSSETVPLQDKDPRNYKDKPACLLNRVGAAGKPMKKSEPLGNLFK